MHLIKERLYSYLYDNNARAGGIYHIVITGYC